MTEQQIRNSPIEEIAEAGNKMLARLMGLTVDKIGVTEAYVKGNGYAGYYRANPYAEKANNGWPKFIQRCHC